MSTDVRLDLGSPVPPFEQIRAQIAMLAERGEILPGVRLPTVRSLAADLGVAAGTVARAYRELEASGVVESHGRRGTVVRATAVPPSRPAMDPTAEASIERSSPRSIEPASTAGPSSRDLTDAVERLVAAARGHGMSAEELAEVVRRAAVAAEPVPSGPMASATKH